MLVRGSKTVPALLVGTVFMNMIIIDPDQAPIPGALPDLIDPAVVSKADMLLY